MDSTTIDFYLVVELFFPLLIGIGPKIALVPFLEGTAGLDARRRQAPWNREAPLAALPRRHSIGTT
jgi:hypothetical protein